jgi:MFS family permease
LPRGFVLRVLSYRASRELIPLYAVYALLFRDHGLSPGAVSSLLVIWSITSFLLEVPSGAWADAVDRRLLLMISAAVYVAAFSSWMLWPAYLGFGLGFVLWGASSALMSGTFEALLYDELAARDATAAYTGLIGWAESLAMVATVVGIAAAGPLYAWGGYALVGWTSVGFAVLHGVLAWLLPKAPKTVTEEGDEAGYLAMLRGGLHEAVRRPSVRHAVLLAAAFGILAFDEYFSLLARDMGASNTTVPWLVALTIVGPAIGTALAGRTAAMTGRQMAWLVAASAVLLSGGALAGNVAGFVALSAGYGRAWNAAVVADARVQDAIEGPARATVTSVVGLNSELFALATYAVVGIGSAWLTLPTLVAVLGLPLFGVATAARTWLPSRRIDPVAVVAPTRRPGDA